MPPGWQEKTREDLRVLTSVKDYKLTYDAILQHDKDIRERIVPIMSNDQLISNKKNFESGWYYGLGRDRSQRPIIILNFRKMIDAGVNFDSLELIDLLTNYTLENAFVPGVVESWNFVIDMKDISLYEFPVSSLIAWGKHMKKSYYIRMNSCTFINTSWLIVKAVNVIYSLLDPF